MIQATTRAALTEARSKLNGRTAVVMTLGALHDGHSQLLRAARADNEHLIATVFVNPLQFGPNEDFDRYPRTLEVDLQMCAQTGVDLVFTPSLAEMYPNGQPDVRVNPGPLGEVLEGASRPGFFHGVLTVVLKLLHLTRPDAAYFGEKDYQQLTLVRRMSADLDLGVDIVGVPTVREADGLALSSRNRYLSATERAAALSLSAAMKAGVDVGDRGGSADEILDAAAQEFTIVGTHGVDAPARLDYLVLTGPSLGPPPPHGLARLLIAARVGATRLIDNAAVTIA